MKQFSPYEIDFKFPYSICPRTNRIFTKLRFVILFSAIALLLAVIFITNNANAKRTALLPETASPDTHPITEQFSGTFSATTLPLALPAITTDHRSTLSQSTLSQSIHLTDTTNAHHIRIKKGDTLASIFKHLGISHRQLHRLVSTDQMTSMLARLIPGQSLDIEVDQDKKLHHLIFNQTPIKSLHVTLTSQQTYATKMHLAPSETRIQHASGIIKSSLFAAGKKAGLSEALTMDMAEIFRWDIDFALDIRKNDYFTVLYEEEYFNGKKIGLGKILAADFVNQSKHYHAVRYTDTNNHTSYYSPEGKSLKKAFLRTPVDFTRISSHFGKRYHPILNRMKSHKGVDYAAPNGTPIKASGNGKIQFRGRKGGYGNTVIIQHGKKYRTLYAHMSRFAHNLKKGSHVKQGQVIGYVGSTGRATGPHLHYEFRVDGKHRNPLAIKLPTAPQIPKKYKQDFLAKTQPLLKQLSTITTVLTQTTNE